jgi:hypothetical protein
MSSGVMFCSAVALTISSQESTSIYQAEAVLCLSVSTTLHNNTSQNTVFCSAYCLKIGHDKYSTMTEMNNNLFDKS